MKTIKDTGVMAHDVCLIKEALLHSFSLHLQGNKTNLCVEIYIGNVGNVMITSSTITFPVPMTSMLATLLSKPVKAHVPVTFSFCSPNMHAPAQSEHSIHSESP